MTIEPIGYFRSPLTSKFGIPRQSGVVGELRGRVDLVGEWRCAEALRGLEEFDYLWLIWGFSHNIGTAKHPTVRPPRLGGNERVGVFASRSPFRPNNIGLSSVRIDDVDFVGGKVHVLGADLMDGTPIYDIKPYVSLSDCHPNARCGFVDGREWQSLRVVMPDSVATLLGDRAMVVKSLIAEDPRPHYHNDASRIYGMAFGGGDVKFRVEDDVAYVVGYDCE